MVTTGNLDRCWELPAELYCALGQRCDAFFVSRSHHHKQVMNAESLYLILMNTTIVMCVGTISITDGQSFQAVIHYLKEKYK